MNNMYDAYIEQRKIKILRVLCFNLLISFWIKSEGERSTRMFLICACTAKHREEEHDSDNEVSISNIPCLKYVVKET